MRTQRSERTSSTFNIYVYLMSSFKMPWLQLVCPEAPVPKRTRRVSDLRLLPRPAPGRWKRRAQRSTPRWGGVTGRYELISIDFDGFLQSLTIAPMNSGPLASSSADVGRLPTIYRCRWFMFIISSENHWVFDSKSIGEAFGSS